MDKESIGDGKIRYGEMMEQLVAKFLLESKNGVCWMRLT